VILPGATIGVLGSGQLGRMFAIAARRLGYHVHTFSPDTDTPTGQIADQEITAAYEDLDAVKKFAEGVDVITFEFENIPSATVEAAAQIVPVRPPGKLLHTTQHRKREKNFLSQNGFPVTPYREVKSAKDLEAACAEIGYPCVLKTAGFGYDGKGQAILKSAEDCARALEKVGGTEWILEGFVDFEKELSVVAARGIDGTTCDWGVVENTHLHHILDVTMAPAAVSETVAQEARSIAEALLTKLDVVGVLCVEFFLTKSGKLLVNELAPRPHNSGHFTLDACVTSQFEQQLRAVCGLPLGSTRQLKPAAMVNLLGDLWQNGEPQWASALALADVKLHLYGKSEARKGRKMGHLTALADTPAAAVKLALEARRRLVKN
jgi:5-(carboxyamino)imidazole ribonucleotide synthase